MSNHRYHFQMVIGGKPHWWVSRAISESKEPSWVPDLREATPYYSERNARAAAGQILRWHGDKIDGTFSIVCYEYSALKGVKPTFCEDRSNHFRYGAVK